MGQPSPKGSKQPEWQPSILFREGPACSKARPASPPAETGTNLEELSVGDPRFFSKRLIQFLKPAASISRNSEETSILVYSYPTMLPGAIQAPAGPRLIIENRGCGIRLSLGRAPSIPDLLLRASQSRYLLSVSRVASRSQPCPSLRPQLSQQHPPERPALAADQIQV
jgi:hypothetical protein